LAVQFRVDASGVAGIGGGSPSSADFSHWSVGTPAFYSLVLLVALIIVIVAVAHSLR
jgi:hypothetical protein